MKKRFLAAYDKYAENLLRHVYFRVSREDLAEDITQETFLRLWRCVLVGDDIKNFKAFLYRIAHNLIIDYYRRHKTASLEETVETEGEFIVEEKNAFEIICDKEMAACALRELDTETRQIIMWRFIDELSVTEIAEITKKTANNISVIIHRGLKKMREKMKNV